MAENKCPYCGNPEIKIRSQKDEFDNVSDGYRCAVCKLDKVYKGPITITRGESFIKEFKDKKMDDVKKRYGEEAAQYSKDYYYDSDWEIFLYKKNKDGEQDFDISRENIEKCKKLFDKNPEDSNNLIRILLLKIFAGEDYKELASKFVVAWKRKDVDSNFYCVLIWRDFDIDEPYKSRLKSFLLWLMDVNPDQFKEDVKEEYIFFVHNIVVGISNVSKLINPERLLFEDFDFRWDDEYLKYYALAKFYSSEKRWYESFCLFEKLRVYNLLAKVTNEELLKFENDILHYKDILFNPPTIEDIEKCAYESLSNINFNDIKERERLKNLLECFYSALWIKENKIDESRKDLESHLKIYNIFAAVFNELAKGNYEAAFSKWVEWDKRGFKLMGIDIWETSKCLKNLRDGIGDNKKNIDALSSANSFIKDFSAISEIEIKLREFIGRSLKLFYGDEKLAWHKGIPENIRIECRKKEEAKYDPKSPQWAYFSFSDYPAIICYKDNWRLIFAKYFSINKGDVAKNKDELTSFLRRLVEIRNTVIHLRRPLEDRERNEIQEAAILLNRIYEKWNTNFKAEAFKK